MIPPDATLTIAEGVLQLTKPAPPRQYRWPIDSFFVSLAEDQGDHAVAVVLSGSGSDGARGLRAVKERGGLTIAQAGFDHVAMSGMGPTLLLPDDSDEGGKPPLVGETGYETDFHTSASPGQGERRMDELLPNANRSH